MAALTSLIKEQRYTNPANLIAQASRLFESTPEAERAKLSEETLVYALGNRDTHNRVIIILRGRLNDNRINANAIRNLGEAISFTPMTEPHLGIWKGLNTTARLSAAGHANLPLLYSDTLTQEIMVKIGTDQPASNLTAALAPAIADYLEREMNGQNIPRPMNNPSAPAFTIPRMVEFALLQAAQLNVGGAAEYDRLRERIGQAIARLPI